MVLQEVILALIQRIYFLCIPDLREVVNIWQRMYVFQHIESTFHLFLPAEFEYIAFFIFYIAKCYCVCGASLLASGLNSTIFHRVAFFFGGQLSILQALNTERTFFHHTTATY